ncbi:MAG: DUF373 family protein [Candidatus Diapherotrites archaeon]
MAEQKRVLVMCIDRDDDLGRKTTIQGPVIGREKNLNAATALALQDPTEADANTMFATVKKYDELKKIYTDIEIATITGHGKIGFQADKKINEQLDFVFEQFPADSIVLITDGMEDDQVIPILQGRAKIISKENVIIKQAQAVESTYYTIKEVLKDPDIARIVFGIPGLVLLLYVALGSFSLQIISFILGAYLLLKGFGIEERILRAFKYITQTVSIHRISFPFYIGGVIILSFGVITSYNTYISNTATDLILQIASSLQPIYAFATLSVLTMILGRCIDVINIKKAYRLRKYFMMSISALMIWLIFDSATLVVLRQADLNWFLFTIAISFAVLLVSYRVSAIIDVRKKITKLLIGLPVYNEEGIWVGKVSEINKKTDSVTYQDIRDKTEKSAKRKQFLLRDGRILIQR